MQTIDWQNAIQAWQSVLGNDAVQVDSSTIATYQANISEYLPRVIPAVLTPQTVEDVVRIVEIANCYRTPLYPISTGKNWGLGSRNPVVNNCCVVDLSKLNHIRKLDLNEGFAIIEPGVTQAQLSQELHNTTWILNVTGSCANTSIIGNALERGVGFLRQRTEDIVGIEAILGTSELIRSGNFWFQDDTHLHYQHGIGPELTPLFIQSNLGIVTAAAISLIKKNEFQVLVQVYFQQEQLTDVIELIPQLYSSKILTCVTKIFNTQALRSYGIISKEYRATAEQADYVMFTTLAGLIALRESMISFVTDKFSAIKGLKGLNVTDVMNLPKDSVEFEIAKLYGGQPTSKGVENVFGVDSSHLDTNSQYGWVTFLPILKLNPDEVTISLDIIKSAIQKFDTRINCTLNILSATAIDMVTSIVFKRETDLITKAHQAQEYLYKEFQQRNICVSRADIEHLNLKQIYSELPYHSLLSRIKKTTDPQHIISPGRYIV